MEYHFGLKLHVLAMLSHTGDTPLTSHAHYRSRVTDELAPRMSANHKLARNRLAEDHSR